ncbi:pyridoxal phosphate-dependent aminotransferase [Castellaniella sp. S9]|uniref:pyridoxal phosphate-dependent aminotransferase n=1 Tax=Castellaniella sp. S9 TaxID=2993652 RepID=UPI0022B48209|nr:pyridoxal phosphate-dependent aminotransferase [Castellaniella sp. S9]
MTRSFEMRNRFFDQLCEDKRLMWMGQNTNHFEPHPAVMEAMNRAIKDGDFHIYAPPLGLEALRHGILEDMNIRSASIMITNGAVEALYNVCTRFNEPGKSFITTDPSWAWPMNFAKHSGAEVIQLPIYGRERGYKLSIEQLRAAVNENTQMIYLVDPNNPLGTCHTADEIKEIADIAKSVGAYLVHDSTYSAFADKHTPAYDFYPEKTIVIYSFSKWLGFAGMRLGAIVASPENIELLASSPPNNLGCNIVAQRAAIAALETKAEWFPGIKARLSRNQKAVFDRVAAVSQMVVPVYPAQANFLIIETEDAGITPEALVSAYRKQNIMIRQGAYHTRQFGHRFVKVSLTVPEEWVDQFCDSLPQMMDEAMAGNSAATLF